jgi:hypothetical protein
MAKRRDARWPWGARAVEDSRARRAAEDSSSAWELISPKKWGALHRRVVPRPPEKLPAAQMQQLALDPASSLPEPEVRQVFAPQEQLQLAGQQASPLRQGVQQPVLQELGEHQELALPQ